MEGRPTRKSLDKRRAAEAPAWLSSMASTAEGAPDSPVGNSGGKYRRTPPWMETAGATGGRPAPSCSSNSASNFPASCGRALFRHHVALSASKHVLLFLNRSSSSHVTAGGDASEQAPVIPSPFQAAVHTARTDGRDVQTSTYSRLAAGDAGGSRKQDSPPPEAAAAGLVIPPKDGSLGAAADAAVQKMAQEQELRSAASAALHSIE
jgi:hypothetical protein